MGRIFWNINYEQSYYINSNYFYFNCWLGFYLTNIKKDNALTVRYYSISELAKESNDIQKIKVGGYIKPNSINISEEDQLEVSFLCIKIMIV